jgi:hypothetical protein
MVTIEELAKFVHETILSYTKMIGEESKRLPWIATKEEDKKLFIQRIERQIKKPVGANAEKNIEHKLFVKLVNTLVPSIKAK